ncbi:hypothetical protein EKO04_001452 [Ascochyta lentis]|uniref:Uncharacterized protein n=1 Tax=Ascochyta lentis TaxID=205686 RepID=A0A8H7JA41_9PLEO|nr:hypothetical protein EKO04_001452 [Ascochyta lentis]
MPPKRKHPNDGSIAHSSTTKRAKARPQTSARTATARRAPTGTQNASRTTATQTSASASKPAKSHIVPTIPRRTAVLGQRNESLLRLPCTNIKTGKDQEQHFQKRNASQIDWNNRRHIEDINSWSNQIYTRAALYVKQVEPWLPDEEAWIELYFHLCIAETRKRGIRQPRIKETWQTFLRFFADRELIGKDGEVVMREPRTNSAFSAKFRRFEELAERLQQCMRGKSGDIFMPDITEAKLDRFKEMKAEMAAKGLQKESAYAGENLPDWLAFFSRLPTERDIDDDEQDGEEQQLEDSGVAFVTVEEDIDAAATLISMASQPQSVRVSARRKRNTNNQENSPAAHSPRSTHSTAHTTPTPASQEIEGERMPDLSRSSLPPSSDGPRTPDSPSMIRGVSSNKTRHAALNTHVVYSDSGLTRHIIANDRNFALDGL